MGRAIAPDTGHTCDAPSAKHYYAGCRCDGCRGAHREHQRTYRAEGVPRFESRERFEAAILVLLLRGWTLTTIARVTGAPYNHLVATTHDRIRSDLAAPVIETAVRWAASPVKADLLERPIVARRLAHFREWWLVA